ncbi:MAG: 16S rRNA (cytidine(1402)-2'-O)-methyltransferase [Bacteroidetes bacterium]|nr:16S rRNA (cytidine(1402)-2'-O)-methyltransferase [Bacteroidota bacterium]
MSEEILPRTLYIVPTPIGNLEDITLRSLHILQHVDAVAAEDTRTTKILLDHYNISKLLISFFSQNEQLRIPQLVERMKRGESLALVSDAGTPGISDPAHSIITACIEEGINIVPLPGATAFIPALVASGLPTHEFVFAGFLPHKKGRQTKLKLLAAEKRTFVLYESPHRLLKTLQELLNFCGNRNAAVGRELTKKFEEIKRGTLSMLAEHFSQATIRGEFVIVVEGADE